MDEQFEKTENSMSIYYTVNKMLIALHMALLVFFVVMRVYVMAAFCVAGVVVYIFSYRLPSGIDCDAAAGCAVCQYRKFRR